MGKSKNPDPAQFINRKTVELLPKSNIVDAVRGYRCSAKAVGSATKVESPS